MQRISARSLPVLATVVLAFGLASCKKDARVEDAPPAVKEAPADVLAIASLPDGLQLSELKAVLSAIDPNAGQAVGMLTAQASSGLGSMLGEIKLDDKAPLHALLLNPKKYPMPVVLVGALTGKGSEAMELRTIGKVSAAGSRAGLDAVAAFVPSLGEAKALRVVVVPKHVMETYRQEIESLPQMMAMMGGGGDALKPILDMYVRFFVALGDNADTVEVLTDHTDTRGSFRFLVRARKDSTLAKFIGAQSPSSFETMSRLPAGRSISMESNIVAGPVKAAFLDVTKELLESFRGIPEDKKAAYTENLERLANVLTGRIAGTMEFKAPPGSMPVMEGAFLAEVEGKGDTKAMLDGMFEAWAGDNTVEIAGTKQTLHFERDAGEHSGVKYSKQTSKVEMTSLGTSYEQTSYFTVVDDKDLLMVIGDEPAMGQAIDSLRAGTKSQPDAKTQQIVDLAKKRKASALMTMDMGPMMGAIATAQKIPLIGFTVVFAGSDLELDLDLFRAQ